MKGKVWISALFVLAALYDGVLGMVFLWDPYWVFRQYNVTPPNHPGYVQFPAALLLIFALMFAAVAWDPVRNRLLVLFGILLKISYCAVAGGYWAMLGIPVIWKPFVIADAVMAVLFVGAYFALGRARQPTTD